MSLLLLGAGGRNPVSFSPDDLSGLDLWLKADAITGLSDNDAVVTWSDESGNGNDLSQAIAANRPTYQTNEINTTLPVVRGDGTNDYIGAAIVGLDQPRHIFIVARWNVYGEDDAIMDGWGVNRGRLRAAAVDEVELSAGININSGTIAAVTDFHIYSLVINGASSIIRVDGVEKVTGNAASNDPNGRILFSDGNGVNHANADVAEIIDYNVVLSAADQASVESYLSAKYGISI